ncbi:hypothetical protein AVEN_175634-1 [Araneus ventricosus]|uniref:Uncharacterized protein n=1 Tax=Araneus ventricosus TaxID=182803 RepID=A0A4Y2G7W6_ARAVE|nr:hypothetical protein AVEN_239520-1 [Araneus ventricosus]GBM49606.1 hypothetical protein AVEN_263261-1 [Araneus ventricosus]GBM49683.1 hypothetical protein AVEN_76402-1 [Araneus ventricosus]GBM49753.1 hypothetical protein AVEN_175634-1 [Araneus ventricosus]
MKSEAVCPQNVQIVQKLTQPAAFAVEMLSRMENEHDFLNSISFSDETIFQVSNKVNISTTTEFGAQKIPCRTGSRKKQSKNPRVVCSFT